ncbi:MAG: hypothetical protein KC657_18760 [Myxococcales bacterium]|nr:hypothetical protein [Myxococcales bacterium]
MSDAIAPRRPLALALAASLVTSACASAGPAPVPRIDPKLHVGEMGARTNFELRAMVASEAAPLPSSDDRGDKRKKSRKVTPALFWTGVILGSVGGAGALGFGIAGVVTERNINNSFDDSINGGAGLSKAEFDRLRNQGDTMNTLAITSAVVGLVGLALAVIVYGHDYTTCGPLAPKRRRCEEAGYGE